jgi:hypothetical protein
MTTYNTGSEYKTINDSTILTVASGELGNTVTRYTYFDVGLLGFLYFSLKSVITATTLTIEACDIDLRCGEVINGTATATNGAGTTITCSTLNTTNGFVADTDLIGLKVVVTSDATTPANVGLERTITAYTGATGLMTLSSALGAVTSGVTQFELRDGGAFSRRVSDPTAAQWDDVTTALTGSATITATGLAIIDTPTLLSRYRIKRVTTNATNALTLRLTRGF